MIENLNLDELTQKHQKIIQEESKENIRKFMQERSFMSKINRFYSYNSKKRYELFTSGFLAIGYCYITFDENNERFRANVLFAPGCKNNAKEVLLSTYKNLETFYKQYNNKEIKRTYKTKVLYNKLFSHEEEPSFFVIPDEYTGCYFVELCSLEFEKDFAMPKEFGKFFLPILFNSKISPLVMPYPDKYLDKLL